MNFEPGMRLSQNNIVKQYSCAVLKVKLKARLLTKMASILYLIVSTALHKSNKRGIKQIKVTHRNCFHEIPTFFLKNSDPIAIFLKSYFRKIIVDSFILPLIQVI